MKTSFLFKFIYLFLIIAIGIIVHSMGYSALTWQWWVIVPSMMISNVAGYAEKTFKNMEEKYLES